ncbi:ion transporter [Fluviicola taffensis]|uniref:ion transporter n=1 Tax=Fluviicola taffensis TaxID=191579 RepID=UPI003137C311
MNNDNKLGFLNLAVIILTFYVLGALVVDTFWVLSSETSKLLTYFDYAICIFFFFEFLYRFIQAENKLVFMKWGWIDLLACIPMIDFLRAGRILRLIRLFRIIRAFRSSRQLLNHIFANKAKGALTSVSVLAILLIIFSSIAILAVETDPKSNIKNAEDAIWWTYTTITTVGYGDKFPVTTEGRILAMVLMTFGVGFFGTFTAYIASIFVANNKEGDQEVK